MGRAHSCTLILTVVDEKVTLQGEGGTEQSFALLALEGSFLRVGLQREQSSISMFIISGCRSLQPAASVRTLMELLKLMGEDRFGRLT